MAERLPLDSPRWNELTTRMGQGGWVRDALEQLAASPSRIEAFEEMWPEICSEGTAYEAAFAVAPYLVSFAQAGPGPAALEYLIVLGLIATCADHIPDDLDDAYRGAVADALAMVRERLADCPADETLRYLLAAAAAFRGRPDLADALQNLDAIQEDCPNCGTTVYPTELQQIIEHDQQRMQR